MKKRIKISARTFLTILISMVFGSTSNAQGTWIQQGNNLNGEAAGDFYGIETSISDNGIYIAVGAGYNDGSTTDAGHVRVFRWASNTWQQVGGGDFDGDAANDHFGLSVSLDADGSVMAVGAPHHDGGGSNNGQVKVFERLSSGIWVQRGSSIIGTSAFEQFGSTVSLDDDGSTLVVGSPFYSVLNSQAGKVRVYDWDGTSWVTRGGAIFGTSVGNRLGEKVSMSSDGNTFAVSVPGQDVTGTDMGAVRIYTWSGTSWVLKGNAILGDTDNERIGFDLTLSGDGDNIIISSHLYRPASSPIDLGRARVYAWNGSSWIQNGADFIGNGSRYGFSSTINNDGTRIAIAAKGINTVQKGYIEAYQGPGWTKIGDSIVGENSGDYAGSGIAMNSVGSKIIFGSTGNDDNGTDAGNARVFKLCITVALTPDVATLSTVNSPTCTVNSITPPTATTDCGQTVVGVPDQTFPITQNTTITWTYTSGSLMTTQTQDVVVTSPIDNTVTVSGNTITANQTGATYQWVDCNNSNAPISGETNVSYTPTSTGNYAVEITQGVCISTSTCTNITVVGIGELILNDLMIYPNPVSETLRFSTSSKINEVRVLTIEGTQVQVDRNDVQINVANLKSGIYFIEVSTEKGLGRKRFIKK